jgi:ABC-type multidrug transport system ATPase subunit/pSer/pThr/pTyr-binding forkhead associated (FHA) protein
MNTLEGCKLVARAGLSTDQIFNLTNSEVIIGRDMSADITIDKNTVSRRHSRIACKGSQFIMEDLNSSNGTFLNGVQIHGETTLNAGDLISISPDFVFEFQVPKSLDQETKLADMQVQTDFPTKAKLIVTIEGVAPGTHTLDQDRITIGRSPENDIVIQSQVMSRKHAVIERRGNDFIFIQLETATNPFYFQGNPISGSFQLNHLDQLQIQSSIPNASVTLQFQAITPETATAYVSDQPPRQPYRESPASTMLDIDLDDIGSFETQTPELVVTVSGQSEVTHRLEKERITIGRAEDNDIVISSPIVSRYHGFLELKDRRYELSVDPKATNRLLVEGRPIDRHRLHHKDIIRIDSTLPGQMVTMTYLSPSEDVATVDFRTISFGDKNVLTFGRDSSNDIVIDVPTVSRYHSQVERIGQRYRVKDLDSSNGTFVNDQRIEEEVWVTAGDTIRIGPNRFVAGIETFSQYDETGGLKVDALGLNKWVRKDLNILKNISLSFKPREFVVVVGQSGGGKSTLLDAIAGYRPATHGRVSVNGIDVYKNFDAIRNEIGYVPQRDIIHMELTVYQALDYAARLRMPKDTTKSERHDRIMEVLDELDLTHRKDVQISGLSGGQQKRVSIGVELLTKPGLFFLDEPTSGLDPGTETSFMHLMRRLADQGRTIILVTHATKNVMLADKVVFLSRGGYLSWFGPPDEALKYFDQYRSERERRTSSMEFDQIYAILDEPNRGKPEQWAERFQSHPAFNEYVVKPLQGIQKPSTEEKKKRVTTPKQTRGAKVSGFRQFLILSARNIKILTRDRSSLILMVLAAPLVAMLDLIIAPLMGSAPYDVQTGVPKNAALTLFLMTIYCLIVAGLSQMREFVKEGDIYKRERLVNLKIFPYVASKVWVAALLSFYHAIAYTVIHYLAFDMPGGSLEFGLIYVTLVFAAMAGMVCGLLASALAPAASSAPMLMILLIIPQIVLSGVLAPIPGYASAPASTRWAFEGLIGITGIGSDVAADPCWQLDKEVRDAMTLEDKEDRGCRCMGVAVFDPESCDFPGLGKYYIDEVDQAPPQEPVSLRPKPTEPVLPPAPEKPENEQDQIAMTKYMNSIGDYQDEVNRIQELYKSEMGIYEAETEVYQAEMTSYQEEYTEWEVARNSAVGGAEGLIENITEEFGWAWVNKEDPNIFWSWLIKAWFAQGVIIMILIGVILFMIKRKDVK